MSRVDLARYRLGKARKILAEAEDNLAQNHYGVSINRSYYAMFTAARALLAIKEMDSSKHSGVIALFNQHIVKAGLFPKEINKFLAKAKGLREDADYGDFVEMSKEDAQTQLDRAKKFVKEVKSVFEKVLMD
ncbi:MAG: HEPN domain-containing protein [bacterium]|nr:HEPN domain-containing protein [bacterium]